MIRLAVLMLMIVSCGKVKDGKDGLNGIPGLDGSDGLSYYSYTTSVSLQEIVGDGRAEEAILDESNLYQLPLTFDVNVDNTYPECELQDFTLNFETDDEVYQFTFQPTENKYKMGLKSGPTGKVVDSSRLRVYYESEPEVDCGDVVYRLNSGVTFSVRIIKELEFE